MRAAALAIALAACSPQTGTIKLDLATAPGSTLLDGVQHLRLTITDPHTVIEADRTASGFDLALELDATGAAGSLIVEGFDGNDALVAAGRSPPFPVAAINAHIVVYMGAPLSIGGSPSTLPASRTGVATAALTFGLVIAGGEDAAGVPTDNLLIYNSYDHSLVTGMAMPAPKSHQTLAVTVNNAIYLFGGSGADHTPTGTLWRFESSVAPNGTYIVLAEQAGLAREASAAIQLGVDQFIVTGTPPADLQANAATARGDVPMLAANGASVVVDGAPIAVFGGAPIQRLRGGTFDALADTVEPTASAAALGDGRVVFAGPGAPATTDLLVVTAATGVATRLPAALSSVRQHAAIAATSRFLVVAGGTDLAGAPVATADIFDATTLAPLTTVPCAARSEASAFVLPDDQIAIVGGTPANDLIELFTPPPE